MSDNALVPSALLDAINRAIAVALRQQMKEEVHQATKRILSRDGKVKLDDLGATHGELPAPRGGANTGGQGAEPPLGNPAALGYVLTSMTDGARAWVPLIAGAGITIERNPTTGAITISATASIQTLVFGGDDLVWGGDMLTFGEA